MIFRDARRDEVPRIVALRFYQSLGFEASHEGLKLPL
jgi:hypothetical protein